jgi:two-component system nitrate/nitrite response regulator NarL
LQADARFSVVAEAGDAGEAQRLAAQHQPDVILLDNHLPGVKGVDAIAGLREVAPQTRVLMLTVSEDETDLAQALRGGAAGYLLKTADIEVLAQAIQRAQAGQATISPEMTAKLVSAFQALPAGAPAAEPTPSHRRRPTRSTRCHRASGRSWSASPRAPATRRSPAPWRLPSRR